MFPKLTIMAGVACAVFAILAVTLGFWAPMVLALCGLLSVITANRVSDQVKDGRYAIIMYLLGGSIATVPPDGSWISWGSTALVSLGLCFWASYVLYDLKRERSDHNWPLLTNIFVSLGLPMLGLGLVQYLVETDRSIVSGVILVGLLTWVGWRLAPRNYLYPVQERQGPWGPYQTDP